MSQPDEPDARIPPPDESAIAKDIPSWSKFGGVARTAVLVACGEARGLGEVYLSTEHLLIALAILPTGGAATAFERLHLPQERIRSEIARQVARGAGNLFGDIHPTPRMLRVFALAKDEAHQLGSATIETEHLLLGLIREGEGLAGRVLAKLGIDLTEARRACKSDWTEPEAPAKSNEPEPKENKPVWQRFTERARRVVFFAQEEAGRLGENYVSTEHILLAMIRENDSVAARILDRMGISLGQIRSEVERQVPRGDGRLGQDMQLTPRAKRVIDLAYDEARQLNNNYIGTEHLLLGLIREAEGLAGRVLTKLGVELESTRQAVIAFQDKAQAEREASGASKGESAALPRRVIRAPYGDLGVARPAEGRSLVEVTMDAVAFLRLIDIFTAKDAHGYRAMAEGDQTLFLLPSGTPLKALVPPAEIGTNAADWGCYVRVLEGAYAGYAGWTFRECFERTGPDDAPFPPAIEE